MYILWNILINYLINKDDLLQIKDVLIPHYLFYLLWHECVIIQYILICGKNTKWRIETTLIFIFNQALICNFFF